MRNGDKLDFEKLDIVCDENFKFCVGDWFSDVDYDLHPSKQWKLSFTLEKDGSVTVWTGAWDDEIKIKAKKFYNTIFYHSGTMLGEYITPCQCPPTDERKYCETCGRNTPWKYKK